jgi:hypothetical protein
MTDMRRSPTGRWRSPTGRRRNKNAFLCFGACRLFGGAHNCVTPSQLCYCLIQGTEQVFFPASQSSTRNYYYEMKFIIINNKTILSFCLAMVLCLVPSSTSFVEAAIPGSTTGLLRGSSSSGGTPAAAAAAATVPQEDHHHDQQQRMLQTKGTCLKLRHPFLNYCKTTCTMYASTLQCIAAQPICVGCDKK